MIERIDPELVAPFEALTEALGVPAIDVSDVAAVRALSAAMDAQRAALLPEEPAVALTKATIPGPPDNATLDVHVYRPADAADHDILPTLLWIHGGGLIFGNAGQDRPLLQMLVKAHRCMVVSVEYRLVPEHPYPAPLDDCVAALDHLFHPDGMVGVDPDRIVVGGQSAGGGLAAATALRWRDEGREGLAGQLLLWPMLSDHTVDVDEEPETIVWSRRANRIAWGHYLGDAAGGDDVHAYAAPARATELGGLPPACVIVGELDAFVGEDVDYAARMIGAGTAVDLHVYPGAYHVFTSLAPDSDVAAEALAAISARVGRWFSG